jgi:uncharacterized protein (DUF433 family)
MPAHDRRCHGKYVITDLGTRVWMLIEGPEANQTILDEARHFMSALNV